MEIFREFFEDDTERGSMSRLLCFLSFFPASYVLMKSEDATIFAWYVGTYAVTYVGGKTADALRGHLKFPTTVINQNPGGNVNVDGDTGIVKRGKK